MKNLIIIFIFLSITLAASNRNKLIQEDTSAQRTALIIGNNKYFHLKELKNPLNDARLIKKTLQESGFRIFYKENATIKDMKKLLRKFTHKIAKGGVGFVYFAGHSANVDGKNYLVATDALLDNQDYISHEAISLNNIIKKMRSSHNKMNILVSDTCRNTVKVNPFHNNHFGRGVGKGLLGLANTEGIYIAYTTASGESVRDGGTGTHGILTKYLVQNLTQNGLSIEDIFQKTKADVYQHTHTKKNFATYNKYKKDFFFVLPY